MVAERLSDYALHWAAAAQIQANPAQSDRIGPKPDTPGIWLCRAESARPLRFDQEGVALSS